MAREASKEKLLKVLKKEKRQNYNEFKKLSGVGNTTFSTALKELIHEGKIIREEIFTGNQKWVWFSLPEVEKWERKTLEKIASDYEKLYKLAKTIRDDKFLKPIIGKPFDVHVKKEQQFNPVRGYNYEYNEIKNMTKFENALIKKYTDDIIWIDSQMKIAKKHDDSEIFQIFKEEKEEELDKIKNIEKEFKKRRRIM